MRMFKVTRLGTIPLSSNRWERETAVGYCIIFAKESKILLDSTMGVVWIRHSMRLNWETASSTFSKDRGWEWEWKWEWRVGNEGFDRKKGKLGVKRETELNLWQRHRCCVFTLQYDTVCLVNVKLKSTNQKRKFNYKLVVQLFQKI